MARKLHIGGSIATAGWEVLDAISAPHVDHVGNAKDLSRFAANTFSKVYASHVLEHFDYVDEIIPTLGEWHRVLRPGGKLYVSTPDLDVLARLFINKEALSVEDRFWVMRMIFGGHTTPYDYHKTGLNEEFIGIYLDRANFVNIHKVDSFNFFADTSNMTFANTPISINMIASKPNR